MKKFFAALIMLAVFVTSSIAFAAFEETVEEDANLVAVKKRLKRPSPKFTTWQETFTTRADSLPAAKLFPMKTLPPPFAKTRALTSTLWT